jgi:Cof subfamily protein (haloacid dehalogenase superfamily)
MKKFEGLLFCSDLDGTLYTSQKTVSKENLDAIEYFKSEGGLFTFVTGRVPQTVTDVYQTIKPNAPFGCVNGAGIYDGAEDKYLWTRYVDKDIIELVRMVDKEMPEMGIQYNVEGKTYFNKDNPALVHFREVTHLPYIGGHYEDVKEPVLKVLFAHHDENQMPIIEKLLKSHPLAHKFDFIRSEKRLYEVLPKGTGKGPTLCALAELLNIYMNSTLAVGDYNNDVSMLKAAGIGFAFANDCDDAKAVADYITVSNNESAIAAIIDGLDKGIYKRKES